MKGSLRKRGKDSWQIQISTGRDPYTGKKKRYYKTVHGSKKDAEKVMRSILHKVDTGTFIEPTKLTLSSYIEDWLGYHKANISSTTFGWYQRILHKHVVPELGNVQLQQLTPIMIQRLYTGKLKSLSQNSVRCIHRILQKALNQAVRLQLLQKNPCAAVDPPKPVRKETKYWTPDQARKFLESIKDDRLFALFYLALGTGLRRGEILGLRWDDINFETSTVSVNKERVKAPGGAVIKAPKTPKSNRTIALPHSLLSVLKHHRTHQTQERLKLGSDYKDCGYVFCNTDGSPLNPDYISCRYFKKLIDLSGSPKITFHGLRHTHATLLGASGISLKMISERLGHSSVAITGDIYSHVFDEMDRKAAYAFDQAVGNAEKD